MKANSLKRLAGRAALYGALGLGSLAFSWPLLWMLGTSVKADRELFQSSRSVLPGRPIPRQVSPYVDGRVFSKLEGPRLEETLALIRGALPAGLDPEALEPCARGVYQRFLSLMPAASWQLPAAPFKREVESLATPAVVKAVMSQISRGLVLGQLRARSYDLEEVALVKAEGAAGAWTPSGPLSLEPSREAGAAGALARYDTRGGRTATLSGTFDLGFQAARLYRLQLSLRSDESWHPLTAHVEMLGRRSKAEVSAPLHDANWSVLTWQEPGPDDASNKIRTWMLLKEEARGEAFDHGPRRIKVVLELGKTDSLGAWAHKLKRNYRLVFDNMPFWRYAATSVFLVLLNLIGTLFSCSVVAYSFARLRWPGRNMSFALMLGTMMIPAQVTMIPFFLIVRWLGWYNTLYPMWVGSFFASAFFVFLLHQFFKGVPKDLEDAAKIDGCGPMRTYWHIMLPLVKPSLATIAIFTFMGVWNDFMGPLIYLGDQRLYPLSLGLYALNVQAGGSMSMMMAGSLLMILPVVAIFFFAQRYFIQGITMTGLKG